MLQINDEKIKLKGTMDTKKNFGVLLARLVKKMKPTKICFIIKKKIRIFTSTPYVEKYIADETCIVL